MIIYGHFAIPALPVDGAAPSVLVCRFGLWGFVFCVWLCCWFWLRVCVVCFCFWALWCSGRCLLLGVCLVAFLVSRPGPLSPTIHDKVHTPLIPVALTASEVVQGSQITSDVYFYYYMRLILKRY